MTNRACIVLLAAGCLAQGCAHDGGGAPSTNPEHENAPSDPGEEADEPPVTITPSAPAAGQPSLLAEVDRELRAMKTSSYSHRTHVDEATGTFDVDCSGLLVYALSRAAPDALAAVQATTHRRPRSVEFVTFLEGVPTGAVKDHWQRVVRAQDLAAGDVIVWLKPADSPSHNTGHTMIVHGGVRPDPGRPGAFVVPVVDSTAVPHGSGDPRGSQGRTGLGQGEIVLVTDGSGAPVGFEWSPGAREKTTTIALGRLR